MKLHLLPNTITWLCSKLGVGVRPMKLQKLMYLSCGYGLALSMKGVADKGGEASGMRRGWLMPYDNDFYAYPYGPVERVVYRNYAYLGHEFIDRYMVADEKFDLEHPQNKDIKAIIELVVSRYGGMSDFQLSDLTHEPDTAWTKAWEDKKRPYPRIRKEHIVDEFNKSEKKRLVMELQERIGGE